MQESSYKTCFLTIAGNIIEGVSIALYRRMSYRKKF